MEGINEKVRIAAYTRISVDDELDRENTSIENQKAIISDYVKTKFPGSLLTFFETARHERVHLSAATGVSADEKPVAWRGILHFNR